MERSRLASEDKKKASKQAKNQQKGCGRPIKTINKSDRKPNRWSLVPNLGAPAR